MKSKYSIKKMLILAVIAALFNPLYGQEQKVVTNSSCRLFADVDNISTVISYIPKGTELKVISETGDYLLVLYDETDGYIQKKKISYLDSKGDVTAQPQQSVITSDNNFNNWVPADRYTILIEKYGQKTGSAIYAHKIWKGIDNNMVKDSWGKPQHVEREIKSTVVVEKWLYRKSWLIFQDGILVEWGAN